MKVAIFGAGKRGEYVVRKIQEHNDAKVEAVIFIDNDPIYLNKYKLGIPVVSLKELGKFFHREGYIIVAAELYTAQEMAVLLLVNGYNNIYMVSNDVIDSELPILNKEGNFMSYIRHIKYCKPCLPYLEYHVSEHCNLKCKGCGHFSNIVKKEKFPNKNEFGSSLFGLSKKFSNIKMIRLMGGEPFLNPDLAFFIYKAKEIFPYSDIRIVTNGLILSKTSTNIIKAIKECGATIDISQYPPTRDIIEDIICFADDNQVKIQIGLEIKSFFASLKSDVNYNTNVERIFSSCISKTCYFLKDKRLYPCPLGILLYENRDFLELDISKEAVMSNSFDLIEGDESGWDILKKLFYPNGFCKYCTEQRVFAWDTSRGEAKKEDWMVENNEA